MSDPSTGEQGKGSELGEALALSPSAPMRVAQYTLTWRDALAWESLPREMRGWHKAIMLLWMAGAGVVLALLPEPMAGAEGSVQYYLVLIGLLAAQYGLAQLALRALHRWRATRRFPQPVKVQLDLFGDHIVEHRSDLPPQAPAVLVPEFVGTFIATPSHMFVPFLQDQVLIVPVSAFGSAADLRAEAAAYEELWAEMRHEL